MTAARTQARGDATRGRLLEAAAALLGEGGYAAISVDAVLSRAGVQRSSLYWHFGSKQGLLMATLEHLTERFTREIQEAVEASDGPLERLDKLVAWARRAIVDRPDRRRTIFSVLLERGAEDPAVRAAVAQILDGVRDRLTHGLARSVGGLGEVGARRVAAAFLAQADGLFLAYLADSDTDALDRRLATLRDVVVLLVRQELTNGR